MKVCFISHTARRGGAELSLLELVDELSQRGVECMCVLPAHGPLEDLLTDRGIETVVVRYKRWLHARKPFFKRVRRLLFGYVPDSFHLAAAIKRSGCDVVYSNTVAVCVGAFAAKLAGKPHVWHIREFGYADHGLHYDLGERISRKLIGWLSSVCIANSRAVADDYRPDLGDTELRVIYNAVEVSIPTTEPPTDDVWQHVGAFRCAVVGILAPGKRQEDAVRAMAHLSESKASAELLLVGDGVESEYGKALQELVEKHELGDRVHLIGYSNEPLPLMSSADVILNCARQEAFGRTTVEAMKLGKPVIGTRSGGTPELVEDGKTGLLYEPGDAKALARQICRLHANPALRESMGQNAIRCARERFSRKTYGDEVEDVLRRASGRG